MIDGPNELPVAVAAARAGAEELMQRWGDLQVHEKGPKDLVTDADYASQAAIFKLLGESFPDHLLIGEESTDGKTNALEQLVLGEQRGCWIVDPLDGTINYVHRLQSFCVSIAYVAEGELQVGVILDPVCDELFFAARGRGAWVSRCNGDQQRPVKVSDCKDISRGMFACSFPAGVKRDAPEVQQFAAVLEECQSLRRLGSCALNLCYVADGRLDGYWTQSVKAWDMAAGALIVKEAGGTVTAMDGGPLDLHNPEFIATATTELNQVLMKTLREA